MNTPRLVSPTSRSPVQGEVFTQDKKTLQQTPDVIFISNITKHLMPMGCIHCLSPEIKSR